MLTTRKGLRRDQRLYRQTVSPEISPPEALTPESKLRYADGVVDARRQRIITVQEDHSGGGEAVNTIAAVCECHSSPDSGWHLIMPHTLEGTVIWVMSPCSGCFLSVCPAARRCSLEMRCRSRCISMQILEPPCLGHHVGSKKLGS